MAAENAGSLAAAAREGVRPVPYWTDRPDAPAAGPALVGGTGAGLAVIGGGFTGLWTALLAKERDPSADVALLEARSVGWAASGRNGCFCSASLTHGMANGESRFPSEMATLVRLGRENLDEIEATIIARGIDCGFERTGELAVATAPWQLVGLAQDAAAARGYGEEVVEFDAAGVRAFAKLAAHFFATFPPLAGQVRFSHAWGGVIDTCSRFCAFFGTAYGGRLGYAAGYTGLGVGASRFGANVMLDLLGGEPTERTSLRMVRSRPVPFPPEPVRSAVIQLTRASLARADRHQGRRNIWLRTLDRLGLGFDS